jgi:hypothetical protein
MGDVTLSISEKRNIKKEKCQFIAFDALSLN